MEIAEIKCVQQEQAKVSKYLNEKMDLILDILQRNLKEPTTKESATEEELDFFVDLPINTKDNLETFENKLKIYDVQPLLDLKFKKQRENLVSGNISAFYISSKCNVSFDILGPLFSKTYIQCKTES